MSYSPNTAAAILQLTFKSRMVKSVSARPSSQIKITVHPWFTLCSDSQTVSRKKWLGLRRILRKNPICIEIFIHIQQDGATVHTARATMDLLRQLFGERIISRNSQINWPPRSPDLSAPYYFLWGYLKERVYVNKPRTLEQLKENTRAEIQARESQTLTNVMNNATERARICEAVNGAHL
jgi:hypothetical protein